MWRMIAGLLAGSLAFAAARDTVIVDTDSGVFGDDGAALTMLLRSRGQVAVAGVTTVSGNVPNRHAGIYLTHILDLLKRPDIPLYSGAPVPIIHTSGMAREAERRWGKLEFAGAFGTAPGENPATPSRARAGAVEFLISEIERHPHEITILAIGPMTNIALALRVRPSIESLIKCIVFMGGNVAVPGNASSAAEFNFWFDPEAARIVLRSRIPRKVMFPLDICNTARIRRAEFDQVAAASTPIAALYREDAGNRYPGFLRNAEATGYLWDELAAAWLLDPGFVTKWETRHLDVQTAWSRFYGATIPLDRAVAPEATPVEVAFALDFRRVFTLYRELLTRSD